ncbi:MAG: hypothetical protein HY272_02035 [Gammaproteobacteria bacterium]|nr:hypothetical protein [Gammaproteobacteria bacterium]
MTVGTRKQTNYLTDDPSTYKAAIDGNTKVDALIAGAFAPHEATTPNMTVKVDAGNLLIGNTLVSAGQQTTGTITAPVGNPRIDRIVIDAITAIVSIITGTPAASPTPPTITTGKVPICYVLLQTSSTAITNNMITDERPLIQSPSILPQNVGVGAGPLDWYSGHAGFDVGAASFIGLEDQTRLYNNLRLDAAGVYRYKNNGYGSLLLLDKADGAFRFYSAPNNTSGAGAAATITGHEMLIRNKNYFIGSVQWISGSTWVNNLPPGWTVSRSSVGVYTVTHNLGVAATPLVVVSAEANGPNWVAKVIAHLSSGNYTAFYVGTFDTANASVDSWFTFTLALA